MKWQITYYSEDVQETINRWSVGIRAFYARITERMKIYGPNLGMPFTDQWEIDCLKYEREEKKVSGGPFSVP